MSADVRATVSPRKPVIYVTVTKPSEIPAQLVPVLAGSGNSPVDQDFNFLVQYLLARG